MVSDPFERAIAEGRLAQDAGDYPGAAEGYREATRLSPDDPRGWVALASCYERDLERSIPRVAGATAALQREAAAAYRGALRAEAGRAEHWEHLGALLESLGELREARNLYMTAIAQEDLAAARHSFEERERRTRSALVAQQRQSFEAAQEAGRLGDALDGCAQAWTLAAGKERRELARRYYRIAAAQTAEATLRALESGTLALAPVSSSDDKPSPGSLAFGAELLRELVARGAEVLDTPQLVSRAKALGIDLRELTPADAARLEDALGIKGLLTIGAGERIQVCLTGLPKGLTRHSESFHLLELEQVDGPPPPQTDPIRLELTVLAERVVDGQAFPIQVVDGAVLKSGDRVQVHLRVDREAYVYLLLFDSTGKVNRLFPHTNELFPEANFEASNPVAPGTTLAIPPGSLWFFLDHNVGQETLCAVASTKRLPQLDQLLGEVVGGAERAQALQRELQEIRTRGFGGVTQGGSSGTYELHSGGSIQQVAEVAAGWGAVVRRVSFVHR